MTFNPARHGLSALSPRPRLRPSWTLEASLLTNGQIDARRFITHHFGLDEFEEAHDVFARGADTGALKVVCTCRGTEKK